MSVLMPIPVDFILKIVPIIFIGLLTLIVVCIVWIIVEIQNAKRTAREEYNVRQIQKMTAADGLEPGKFLWAMREAMTKGWIAKRPYRNGDAYVELYVVYGDKKLQYGYATIENNKPEIRILGDYSPSMEDMTCMEWTAFEGDEYKVIWKKR